MTPVTETIQSAKAAIANASRTVRERIDGLRRQLSEKVAALHHARTDPLPLDEIEARARQHVASVGAWWMNQHGRALVFGEQALGSPTLKGDARLPWNPREPLPWGALCAGAPSTAIAILMAVAGQVPYEPGLPEAQRPGLIARLEREVTDLDQAEESTVDEAAAAGVAIAHRPEVIQRRQAAARERELLRAGDLTGRPKQTEDELNERHTKRVVLGRGNGRSRYIEDNKPGEEAAWRE